MSNILPLAPLPSRNMITAEETVALMLRDCGLGDHLHDRALYQTSRTMWEDGYVRGRTKQERLADLVVNKLGYVGPADGKLAMRRRVIEKTENDYMNLPETLDFLTWANKVNRPDRVTDTFKKSPVTTQRSQQLLSYYFEIAFEMPPAEAVAVVNMIRRRELADIQNCLLAVAVFSGGTLHCTVACSLWSSISSLSMTAKASCLAKASAAGIKMKVVLLPIAYAGGAVGVASGAASASAAVVASYYGVSTVVETAYLARLLWRDRFELARQSLRDAAVVGVIQNQNRIAHESLSQGNEVAE